jgi:hypothetical protein
MPAKQIPDVALQCSAQSADNLQLSVLRAGFQPSQGCLTYTEPSGKLALV